MSTLLRTRRPVSRGVSARCTVCGTIIPRGQRYQRDTLVEGRDLWDWCTCEACEPLLGIYMADADGEAEEFTVDDLDGWAMDLMADGGTEWPVPFLITCWRERRGEPSLAEAEARAKAITEHYQRRDAARRGRAS
ncbi:hypothetical protein GZ998_05365 [Actinomyces sp. 594]|uniref:hypothetical protein n=1 Tax=Actinomyces sp. 594 TaxID=2057793 RepID=UPI001C588777|nr:hypothetical protein [Actinomyces sp. 594]MBW3068941.1 hypothetical protein [Actinomyces sp. 594]